MKVYVEVQLASDVDATVRRTKLQGVTEAEDFHRLTRVIESVLKHYAREVVTDRDRLGAPVA